MPTFPATTSRAPEEEELPFMDVWVTHAQVNAYARRLRDGCDRKLPEYESTSVVAATTSPQRAPLQDDPAAVEDPLAIGVSG